VNIEIKENIFEADRERERERERFTIIVIIFCVRSIYNLESTANFHRFAPY